MPSATRKPSPGPSALPLKPQNTKKRALSEEGAEEGLGADRDPKKPRSENLGEVKDRDKDKKRRRKKKRKMSIVTLDNDRLRSKPASAGVARPPASSNANTNGDVAPQSTTSNYVLTDTPSQNQSANLVPDTKNGKGKEKASSPTQIEEQPEASSSEETPEATITRLTRELEAKNEVIASHTSTLTALSTSLTCQICLDLMHKPYALAPCGHLACYPCLVRWFTAPPPDAPGNNNNNDNNNIPAPNPNINGTPQLLPPPSNLRRKKTCPHCRAVVRERPVEVWGVKSMVGVLSKSGLLAGSLPPPPSDAPTPNANTNAQADPWTNIFRPTSNHANPLFDHPIFGQLFLGPGPNANGGGNTAEMGMHDVEDGGIYRCLDCMHEIWDGECTGCGRVYPGHHAGGGGGGGHGGGGGWGDDGDDLGDAEFMEMLRRADGLDDDEVELDGDEGVWDEEAQDFTWGVGGGGIEEEEEEEEEDYESSFIDDEEGHVARGLRTMGGGRANEVIVLDPSDSEAGIREMLRAQARAVRILERAAGEEEGVEFDDVERVIRPRVRRRRAPHNESDEDEDKDEDGSVDEEGDEEGEDVGSESGSESEEEEEEVPVRNARRGARALAARLGGYGRGLGRIVDSEEDEGDGSVSEGEGEEEGGASEGEGESDEDIQVVPRSRRARPARRPIANSESDEEASEVDRLAAEERSLYGEDDSIPGPPARLRHLLNPADESGSGWFGRDD